LTDGATAPPEVTRFLREHPPFDGLELGEVERVAASVEVEFHRSGTSIFLEGAEPIEHLRVVRRGAVEIIHGGHVLDLLGEGELFGHAAMLSGLPTGFEARAAEDMLCYRIGSAIARELLSAPAGLRYVARSLAKAEAELYATSPGAPSDPSTQPVGSLIRGSPVVCEPDTPIRDAAQMMTAASATSLVVDVGDGTLGILTDRDLRTRVVASGMSVDAPVSAAISTPAFTSRPDRLGGEVLLEMLDRGLRHLPVVSGTGEVLGVLEDLDLIAIQTRSSFFLRQRIARAGSLAELKVAAAELRPSVVDMHEARVNSANIVAIYSVEIDALTRRLLELAIEAAGEPPVEFAWLALGSVARREAVLSSDVESAIAWFGNGTDGEVRAHLHRLGQDVVAGLEACGFSPDPHGASASNVPFVRSLQSWQSAGRSWIADPTQDKALVLTSLLVDSRPVWGVHKGTPVADTFRLAPTNPALLRMLARFALSHRPPTGFFRGFVVEHTGEHRGQLDLKLGGIQPIVDLARWAGIAAGVTTGSTAERLRAAGAEGTLPGGEAQTLEDALDLIETLRLGHQADQLRAGVPLDDHVNPATLSSLTRSHLREAFRAVASIQKRVAAELEVGTW
jgi:CBS domain-containing protein